MPEYRTEQESFWAGSFGDEYIDRNSDLNVLASKTAMFSKILAHTRGIESALELGANIGLNMIALRRLLPDIKLEAVEINKKAFSRLSMIENIKAHHGSILDYKHDGLVDLSFTVGVLIHIAPTHLNVVYHSLYTASCRYIALAEYYNPTPVEVSYRGHSGRLFKRDWAGEMLSLYSDLILVDYGFVYHGDKAFPADDINWFLLEKRS